MTGSTSSRDYYDVLGVSRDANADEIERAYRRLALRYHPDRCKESDATAKFKEVSEAYAILADPEKRRRYDAHGFSGVSGYSQEDLFGGIDLDSILGGAGGFNFESSIFDRKNAQRAAAVALNPEQSRDNAKPATELDS